MRGNKIRHELDARGVLHDFHFDALGADEFLRALEGLVFTHNDVRDFIEQRGAAAHGAWRERGIQSASLINGRLLAARVFEAVHLGVVDDAALLDALVVAASDDFAVAHEHGTDGDAASGEALFRLVNGGLQEGVHGRGLYRPKFKV